MEYKELELAIKADGEQGIIEGYGSVFNVVDSHGDKVMPGAFADSLRVRTPKMLWQHDMSAPIGKWTEVREDGKGLFLRGQIAMKSDFARDKYELIKAGALDGLSIGYVTKEDEESNGIRSINRADLYEVSPVTIGSNAAALIEAVKSGHELTVRDIERVLRDTLKNTHGISNTALKAMAGSAWDGYERVLREAGVTGPEHDQREVGDLKRAFEQLLDKSGGSV